MRSRLTALAILAVLGAGFGLSACGDDTAEQLDADELVSRADEICQEGIDRFGEIQSEQADNPVEAEEQTAELFEVASEELDDLRALRPPDELRDSYEAFLGANARTVELLERGRDAASEKDGKAYAEAKNEAILGQKKRIELAEAVGLEVCSRPQ